MQSVRNSDLQTVYYGILIHKYSSEIQPFKMCDVSYGDFRPTPVHPIHIINIEKKILRSKFCSEFGCTKHKQ